MKASQQTSFLLPDNSYVYFDAGGDYSLKRSSIIEKAYDEDSKLYRFSQILKIGTRKFFKFI